MTNDVDELMGSGIADSRTAAILEAGAQLLAEGGYPALTMRALAQRSDMSPGLIYRYFTDKRDVFATLLHENQLEIIDALRRDEAASVEDFLLAVAPPIIDQWVVVGRMADSFVDAERERTERVDRLVASTREQMEALEEGLRRAAEAEGRVIDPSPLTARYVWFSLMGLAENMTVGWHDNSDDHLMVPYTVRAIARGVLLD